MPVGRLTEEEFLNEMGLHSAKESHTPPTDEVESHLEDTSPTIIDKPTNGRATGSHNIPDVLRKIIGETSVIDGRQEALQLARDFGVSDSSVSAYAHGNTSTAAYHKPSQSILNHISKSRIRAVKRASTTLNQALSSITQEKLDHSDVKDLSTIAKEMSVIIKNLEPPPQQQEATQNGTPQFVIFAPKFRSEHSFGEVIDVKE